MKLNEDFKIKVKKAYSILKNLFILVLLGFLIYEYITIEDFKDSRLIDIKTPFFNTQFLQDLSKPKI